VDRWSRAVDDLLALGREAHARGWVPGTSGNFSVVVREDPLELAMTPSGHHKGRLHASEILRVDAQGMVLSGKSQPSAEAALHLAVIAGRRAGAVAHTHSRAATLLSDSEAPGIVIEGYELLKGLSGVKTHLHREFLPLVDNSQDWPKSAPVVRETLARNPAAHGFLIRRHGLYTWGVDAQEAARHLEVFESLLDILAARNSSAKGV
jgi:methylthioribulose-1-phosphate dehydratase